MKELIFEIVYGEDIEICRDLCNELMAFQKSKAHFRPELFDFMNFETRMKLSYGKAEKSQVIIVKDGIVPVGYVFSSIDLVEIADKRAFPSWFSNAQEGMQGFYPEWVELPQKIGCLNNLYLREEYRGLGLGEKLFDKTMAWLHSFSDTELTFVYVSNGNEIALDFYLTRGFTFSHDVFGGFIKAAYRYKGN